MVWISLDLDSTFSFLLLSHPIPPPVHTLFRIHSKLFGQLRPRATEEGNMVSINLTTPAAGTFNGILLFEYKCFKLMIAFGAGEIEYGHILLGSNGIHRIIPVSTSQIPFKPRV